VPGTGYQVPGNVRESGAGGRVPDTRATSGGIKREDAKAPLDFRFLIHENPITTPTTIRFALLTTNIRKADFLRLFAHSAVNPFLLYFPPKSKQGCCG
jgi:hypothetical protein